MCGIVGQYYFNIDALSIEGVQKALPQIAHRGPDKQSVKTLENCVFGHARLSVIDLSPNGDQPMLDPSGRYILTFNGEIYNYRELRHKLEKKGYSFKGNSDTEVLLNHLIEYGADGINELNGFFAFGFYDRETDSILVARDRFGIKPVYWFSNQDAFSFCSELKPLISLGSGKEINRAALANYFRFNYIPAPDTLIDGVFKLEPGHYITVKNQQISFTQYYDGHISVDSDADLYNLMDDSVQKRLVADIEVGSFLSGGLDSSIIAAIAAKHKPGLKTFSVGFQGQQVFDESQNALTVAKHIGSDHTQIQISSAELIQAANQISVDLDEPFADSSAIAVYCLSQHVKKHVTVALSGDGADELFAGYNKHIALLRALKTPFLYREIVKLFSRLPFQGGRNSSIGNKIRQIKKLGNGLRLGPYERYILWSSFCSEIQISKLIKSDVSPYDDLEKFWTGRFEDYLIMDQKLVLPNDMLRKVDSMSMMHSLEVRVPFLDHRIVEFARSLQSKDLISNNTGKQILRSTFSNLLPDSTLRQPKHGFEVPIKKWIKNELSSEINDVLHEDRIKSSGLLNSDSVTTLLRQARSKQPGDAPYQVWAIFVLHNWIDKNL